jgi:hypothetical protein
VARNPLDNPVFLRLFLGKLSLGFVDHNHDAAVIDDLCRSFHLKAEEVVGVLRTYVHRTADRVQ